MQSELFVNFEQKTVKLAVCSDGKTEYLGISPHHVSMNVDCKAIART